MGFFKQKGPLQRDFCEVLLYVVALWALKPASLQDILTVNQCDGMWFFSAAFCHCFCRNRFRLSSDYKSFRCMESNTRQCQSNNISGTSEICAVRKSKVAIEPKLASCILVVLAGCLTAAFVWFTFICR